MQTVKILHQKNIVTTVLVVSRKVFNAALKPLRLQNLEELFASEASVTACCVYFFMLSLCFCVFEFWPQIQVAQVTEDLQVENSGGRLRLRSVIQDF